MKISKHAGVHLPSINSHRSPIRESSLPKILNLQGKSEIPFQNDLISPILKNDALIQTNVDEVNSSVDHLNLNEPLLDPILSNTHSESQIIEEEDPIDIVTKQEIKNVLEKPPQQTKLSNFEVFVLNKLAKLNVHNKEIKQAASRRDLTDEYAYLLLQNEVNNVTYFQTEEQIFNNEGSKERTPK